MTLLRTGVIGMAAFVILAAGLLRALWRLESDSKTSLLAPGIFPALLVTQLVWFLTWVPGNEVGIIIGLALALAGLPQMMGTRSCRIWGLSSGNGGFSR
jgi:hypothetical protein